MTLDAANYPSAPELHPTITLDAVCELLVWVVAELAAAYTREADLARREVKDYRLRAWIAALEAAQDKHWEWYAARKAG